MGEKSNEENHDITTDGDTKDEKDEKQIEEKTKVESTEGIGILLGIS